jgi:DNA ligase (NAD+)
MNIDSLGEGKIEVLFDQNLVKNPADLYSLSFNKLLGIEKVIPGDEVKPARKVSFKHKTVENIIKGINSSKNVPFERVLFALGIRHVGETIAKKLTRHFGNIDALMSAKFDELVSVSEIGEKIASSVLNHFADNENVQIINKLIDAGIRMQSEQEDLNGEGILLGKIFVVSGVFNRFSRDGIIQSIEKSGGKVSSSISKKTDFVLAGENMGPEKRRKAEDLGVKIISEEDYLQMIE